MSARADVLSDAGSSQVPSSQALTAGYISGLAGVTGTRFRGPVVWKLKLVSGTYRYRSDTHPKTVHGSFRVG
jgi:hypothetical protein